MKPALVTYPYISSYPVLMLLGFIGGWLLARQRGHWYAISSNHLDNLAILLPLAGLFGARLFARLFYAKLPFLEALEVWKGDGLVFYGGFLVASGVALAYGFGRGVNMVRLADCLAPAVALGLAFGRIGCFLAGCCWGDVCVADPMLTPLEAPMARQVHSTPFISSPSWPLTVRFPPGSEPYKQQVKLGLIAAETPRSLPVHPVQLYEAALAAVLCLALHLRFRANHPAGAAALRLVAGYAVIRFLTEFLRADNKIYALGLTFSQVISIVLLGFCFVAVLVRSSPASGTAEVRRRRQPETTSAT